MNLKDYYRRRRRVAAWRRGAVFFFLLLAPAALWGFFWIPFFRVTQIKIYNYPDEEGVKIAIKPYLDLRNKIFLPQDSFWLLATADVENVLKSKDFGTPKAKKVFPRGLSINFPEVVPWLIFCATESECFYVSSSGELKDRAPRFSDSPLPELSLVRKSAAEIGERIISEKEASFLAVFLNALKGVSATPEKIAISAGSIKIFLEEGWFILASPELPPEKVSGELRTLLDQKIGDKRMVLEYIDMRFLNKAFYKLKSVN